MEYSIAELRLGYFRPARGMLQELRAGSGVGVSDTHGSIF